MNVKISVIAVAMDTKPTAKGSYQIAEVTYKDLDKNKVASKKIMSFTKPESIFKTMAVAKQGDIFDVELVKNEQSGYWDWTNVTKGSASQQNNSGPSSNTSSSSISSSGSTSTKGGWETPEERAKKQIYIVRQSSLGHAVSALSVGAKTHPKAEDVIEYARKLESFVFEAETAAAVAKQDVGTDLGFSDLEDLPY